MADFNAFKITDAGRALLASIIGTEGDKIAFTKFVTSDEEIDYSTAETITSLKSPKQTKPVESADYIPPDAVKLTAQIRSDGVQTGYYIRTLVLYAQSEQKQQEIIFAITTQKNQAKADWMSPAGSISQSTIQIIANILIMDAEVASVTIVPNGTVSVEVFNSHVQNESLGIHGSTVEATPGKLMMRDESGYGKVKSPSYEEAEDEHIMNKKSVIEAISSNIPDIDTSKIINIYDPSKTYKMGDIVAIEKEIEISTTPPLLNQ